MKKYSKAMSAILSLILILLLLSACSDKAGIQTGSSVPEGEGYPIKTDVTLTYWMDFSTRPAGSSMNFGETAIGKAREERTGVKINYIHPTKGQALEQFNLMLASGDLPDIVETNWSGFKGGPNKAIDDGYIVALNNYTKYAPNLMKYLKDNSYVDKLVKTDEGTYYGFPFIRGDEYLLVFNGPIIRKDWLDDVGKEVPETVNEWYDVLKAFKEKKGAPAAFSALPSEFGRGSFLAGAYGVTKGFYVENGKVEFGSMQPGYKDYLTTMNKWYSEGILDNNFAVIDSKTVDANIVGGKSGATIGFAGSSLSKWLASGKEKNPNYNLVAAPYPSVEKGQIARFGQRSLPYEFSGCAAITKKCKNKEIAARFLDFGYSKEGCMLFNFGIEGESYNMVDGYPAYTDKIMKNSEGLSISEAMSNYILAHNVGPFIQDKRYLEQYLSYPQQKEAVNVWMKTDAEKYSTGRLIPTPQESTQLSKIMGDVNTYINEMHMKFIMGVEPLSKFDEYVERIKSMGIDKVLEIQQAAYERSLNN